MRRKVSPSRVDRLLDLMNTVNSAPTHTQTVYKHECYSNSALSILEVRDTPMVDCSLQEEEASEDLNCLASLYRTDNQVPGRG